MITKLLKNDSIFNEYNNFLQLCIWNGILLLYLGLKINSLLMSENSTDIKRLSKQILRT